MAEYSRRRVEFLLKKREKGGESGWCPVAKCSRRTEGGRGEKKHTWLFIPDGIELYLYVTWVSLINAISLYEFSALYILFSIFQMQEKVAQRHFNSCS